MLTLTNESFNGNSEYSPQFPYLPVEVTHADGTAATYLNLKEIKRHFRNDWQIWGKRYATIFSDDSQGGCTQIVWYGLSAGDEVPFEIGLTENEWFAENPRYRAELDGRKEPARPPNPYNSPWREAAKQIISRLNLRSEYEQLGIEITGRSPNQRGWIECRAINRDDRNPSAGINVHTGRYKAFNNGESQGFFDFAARHKPFDDFRAARNFYAAQTGVELPTAGNGRESGPCDWHRDAAKRPCENTDPSPSDNDDESLADMLTSCHFWKTFRHRESGNVFAGRLSCGRWRCPDCRKSLLKKWTKHIEMRFKLHGENIYKIKIDAADWQATRKQITRARRKGQVAEYVRIRASDSELIIFATVPLSGETQFTHDRAGKELKKDLSEIPRGLQKMFSTSTDWRLPAPKESGCEIIHNHQRVTGKDFLEAAAECGVTVEKARPAAGLMTRKLKLIPPQFKKDGNPWIDWDWKGFLRRVDQIASFRMGVPEILFNESNNRVAGTLPECNKTPGGTNDSSVMNKNEFSTVFG